jgi:very-short-patch-repair endonuclease
VIARGSWFTKSGGIKGNVIRRYADPETLFWAKKMRRNPTRTEKILWEKLLPLNLRIRRQAVILGWIADFYHPKSKLVIEVDGGYHRDQRQQSKDAYRDSVMKRKGLRIIRIPDHRVHLELETVINEIIQAISSQRKAVEPEACGRRGGSREVLPPTTRRKSEIV